MFDAKAIKVLRLRLGWTHADLARRLSCGPEEIKDWEEGRGAPHRDAINQMQYLQFKAENLAHDLASRPMIDHCLRSHGLEQVTSEQHRDLEVDPRKSEV